MKLNICMLLPLRYTPNMRVNPQIGIASYLSKFSHRITWIIFSETSRRTEHLLFDDIQVYTAPYIRYLGESSLAGKIFNLIRAVFKKWRVTLSVFRQNRYDLVFVRDDILDGLIAIYIKKKYKTPFIYELSNPLEQTSEIYKHRLEAVKLRLLHYLIAKFSAAIAIFVMKQADLILPTTGWFEDGLVRRGIPRSKLMPFPNGVDVKSSPNKDGKEVREQYRLGNSATVIYVGVVGKSRQLSTLIRAFSKVRAEKPDVKLLIVGDGTDRQSLEKLAAEIGEKDNIIFTGEIPQSQVANFIAAADIGVSPVTPYSFFKVSSPIKALEYMALAKPIVANEEIYEHSEVLNKSGGGILVPFTSEAFASAIIELLNNPARAREMGRKGQEWIIRNRSYDILARKLEDKYMQLVKK